MVRIDREERRRRESLDRTALEAHQLARLNQLLDAILPDNSFYAEKLAGVARPLESLDRLAELPLTTKAELLAAQVADPVGGNRTFPLDCYVRYHQTSGTQGRPLVVLDTADDWRWWIDCWQYVLDAAELDTADRVMMAFSFGPFIGFWSAFDAAVARGCLVIPGGGMSSLARLETMRRGGATVICCTPSYALHLAAAAAQHHFDLAGLRVRVLIVAGEPGGSIETVRRRIERSWNARVVDHSGASELGPWGFADSQRRGLHVIESEFIAEFFAVGTGQPAREGELAELVITNLGRYGCPLIRYRTGDLVRPRRDHDGDRRLVLLEGGILGRADDMMIIRGVNIFPSGIEEILRSFDEIDEYRMTAHKADEMDRLTIEIEDRLNDAQRVAERLRSRLGLRIDVECVPPGTLPRFEAKGKRFIDKR